MLNLASGYITKSTNVEVYRVVLIINEIKQEIIALIEKVDDPRALNKVHSLLLGILSELNCK